MYINTLYNLRTENCVVKMPVIERYFTRISDRFIIYLQIQQRKKKIMVRWKKIILYSIVL